MNPAVPQSPVFSISSNGGSITVSYKNTPSGGDMLAADEKCAILEWLSPLEPRERHHAIGITRVAGVGDWLLRTNEFIRWHGSGDEMVNPVLFCYGGPGVGKTYLNSLVMDKLWDRVDVDNVAVVGAYCQFTAQNAQSAAGLVGVLLKQVVSAMKEIPIEVKRAFESSKGIVGGRKPLLPDILGMLVKSLSCLEKGFICIDALDEFPSEHRPELWESLQKIVRECPNTRVFLTGRLHIREEARKYFPENAKMLRISPTKYEIESYIRARLSKDPELDAMDKELEADILRIILETMSGTFLLVSLSVDAVLAEATTNQRRQALDRLSKGIGLQDAYNKTFDRIRQQGGSKSKLGMEALMWISYSKRPLKSEELCHALGVELGAGDLNNHNVPSIRTVLSCTLGLVTINQKASTIRLLHPTLLVYLGEHPALFATAHSMMAEICLTYLNYRSVRALPPCDPPPLATKPFLQYATCYWGDHATRGVTEPVKALALQLLDGYESHVSAAILWRVKIHWWCDEVSVQGISGLHCIAFWGISEIATAMLETERWDVNSRDSMGETPLMWAAQYSKGSLVNLFLDQGAVKPDLVSQEGLTALSIAVQCGNESAVQQLLERADVNPDLSDNDGRAPLSYAAERDELRAVQLLLERADVNPDSPDNSGRTPLSYAAEGEALSVVELLLKRGDVNPDSQDKDGRTPLSYAVERETLGVVELLLKNEGVSNSLPDNNGRTPLSYATNQKTMNAVKLLLEPRDVNLDLQDKNGGTPISYIPLHKR